MNQQTEQKDRCPNCGAPAYAPMRPGSRARRYECSTHITANGDVASVGRTCIRNMLEQRDRQLQQKDEQLRQEREARERAEERALTWCEELAKEREVKWPKDREDAFQMGWQAAHESAKCGHARANYRDPKYGTDDYEGDERCEMCDLQRRAEKAEAELERVKDSHKEMVKQWRMQCQRANEASENVRLIEGVVNDKARSEADRLSEENIRLRAEVEAMRPVLNAAKAWRARRDHTATQMLIDEVRNYDTRQSAPAEAGEGVGERKCAGPTIDPRDWEFVSDSLGGHIRSVHTGEKWRPESDFKPPICPVYDSQGNEYLLTGEYRKPLKGETFIHPNVDEVCVNATGYSHFPRWIVRPTKQCQCRPESDYRVIERLQHMAEKRSMDADPESFAEMFWEMTGLWLERLKKAHCKQGGGNADSGAPRH